MRAPIGLRISSKRRAIGISQAALARRAGISASYLNLIEGNKRHVGGSLLIRLAQALELDIGELSGEAEHRLIAEVDEALADPLLAGIGAPSAHDLVAQQPAAALAIARLHRAYQGAQANADDYADRLRADPLLAQLLHRVLSGITAVRSSAEILDDVSDLDETERRRFIESIARETKGLSEVAHGLVGQFEVDAKARRLSPQRELDDLIFENDNYFPALEQIAADLRREVEAEGPFGEATLMSLLGRRFGITIRRSANREVDAAGFPGQYRYDAIARTMWFQTSAIAATRQFQLTRLFAELVASAAIEREVVEAPELTSTTSRRLAYRALGSYLAGAVVFPYAQFLASAEALNYDIEALQQGYTASFEQVAHRLVTLRKPGESGVPFGFLRSDPAGRLTKLFPMPGLPLPSAGHACPLWAIYDAFRTPERAVRQLVQFPDGSRYLFIARAQSRRPANFADRAIHTSIMLACDALQADRTVYGAGLALGDPSLDVPVGPSCRLCPRRDCAERQEEALAAGGRPVAIRAPLVARAFDVGEAE
jgi:predicted transcriptional regulator/transcriptional regulator with XRE-family HTH domain